MFFLNRTVYCVGGGAGSSNSFTEIVLTKGILSMNHLEICFTIFFRQNGSLWYQIRSKRKKYDQQLTKDFIDFQF